MKFCLCPCFTPWGHTGSGRKCPHILTGQVASSRKTSLWAGVKASNVGRHTRLSSLTDLVVSVRLYRHMLVQHFKSGYDRFHPIPCQTNTGCIIIRRYGPPCCRDIVTPHTRRPKCCSKNVGRWRRSVCAHLQLKRCSYLWCISVQYTADFTATPWLGAVTA